MAIHHRRENVEMFCAWANCDVCQKIFTHAEPPIAFRAELRRLSGFGEIEVTAKPPFDVESLKEMLMREGWKFEEFHSRLFLLCPDCAKK